MTIEAWQVYKCYRVRLYCECGGEMVATGRVIEPGPTEYVHRCTWCGKTVDAPKVYPHIGHMEVIE